MKKFIFSLFCLILSARLVNAELALSGTLGTSLENASHHFAYSVAIYHKIDDQALLGVTSGQQQGGIPLLASLFMRLPIGGIVLPVVTGDLGYLFHKSDAGFIWKGGGGLDWKNGEHSSILLLGGYESSQASSGLYSRLGVLLEF